MDFRCSFPDVPKKEFNGTHSPVFWQEEGKFWVDNHSNPLAVRFETLLGDTYQTFEEEFTVVPSAIYALPTSDLYRVAGRPVKACCDVVTKEIFFSLDSNFETMLHELTHLQHPSWTEGKVISETNRLLGIRGIDVPTVVFEAVITAVVAAPIYIMLSRLLGPRR